MRKPKPGTEAWRAYWAAQIEAAQHVKTSHIRGQAFDRIPYAPLAEYAGRPTCRDCGCAAGQLHVMTCCIERCPRCRVGQALTCPCGDPDSAAPPIVQ